MRRLPLGRRRCCARLVARSKSARRSGCESAELHEVLQHLKGIQRSARQASSGFALACLGFLAEAVRSAFGGGAAAASSLLDPNYTRVSRALGGGCGFRLLS